MNELSWCDEDPGSCPHCGESWEMVRPGKSQPICDCHEKCSCGGRITHHTEWEYPDRNILGWYCEDCFNKGAW